MSDYSSSGVDVFGKTKQLDVKEARKIQKITGILQLSQLVAVGVNGEYLELLAPGVKQEVVEQEKADYLLARAKEARALWGGQWWRGPGPLEVTCWYLTPDGGTVCITKRS